MVQFADEKDHYLRRFSAAWPAAGDGAEVLADKIQKLVRRLALIDPAYGEVRPILEPRPFRLSDPGQVLDMNVQELGMLIDRRTRLNPPRFPAPVDKDGYSIVLGPNRTGLDPRKLEISLKGGQYRQGVWDELELLPHRGNPVWWHTDLALTFIDILIDVLDCQCASAWAFISDGERGRCRPWMTWVAKRAASSLPYPFPFDDAPPADRKTEYREGELRTWP